MRAVSLTFARFTGMAAVAVLLTLAVIIASAITASIRCFIFSYLNRNALTVFDDWRTQRAVCRTLSGLHSAARSKNDLHYSAAFLIAAASNSSDLSMRRSVWRLPLTGGWFVVLSAQMISSRSDPAA